MDRARTRTPPQRRGGHDRDAALGRHGPHPRRRSVLSRSPTEREIVAARLEARLAPVFSALGILFVLIVLGDLLTGGQSRVHPILVAATWVLWGVFVAEYILRAVIAPETWPFLRRTWWQILLLLLPFLQFVRVIQVALAGRVLSSTVRGARSAGANLRGRLGWLALVSAMVILGASEFLYGIGVYPTLGQALHSVALTTIAQNPLGQQNAYAQILEVILFLYSVVVFAALAGSLGAYYFEQRDTERQRARRASNATEGVGDGSPN